MRTYAKTSLLAGILIALAGCAGSSGDNGGLIIPEPNPGLYVTHNNGVETLAKVDLNSGGVIVESKPITGLQAGETIVGMDVRPLTQRLYALGSTGQLYILNTFTGAATAVGTPNTLPNVADIDFNPIADRIRVVGAAGLNGRLNPDTGVFITDTDTTINLVALAYNNNFTNAVTTDAWGLDSNLFVARLGGPLGSPSPNSGIVTSFNATAMSGATTMDISQDGTVYAARQNALNSQHLYTVNLVTGTATFVCDMPGEVFGTIAYKD